MKDKPLFGCPNRPAALIAAMAAALLLAPGTVFAQGAYYQFYNLALGIENVSPADSQYTEAFADLPAPGKGSVNGNGIFIGRAMPAGYSAPVWPARGSGRRRSGWRAPQSASTLRLVEPCSWKQPQTDY